MFPASSSALRSASHCAGSGVMNAMWYGPAGDVAAADVPQVGADQAGAGAQADQPCRARLPRRRRLRRGQRQEAADLRSGIRGLGPLPRQRRILRVQGRDDGPAEEPQVRAQRPPGGPGQARRVHSESPGHRRVQQHLRRRIQAERDRPAGQLAGGPQQVTRAP
jgi:hypothetical protein